jgi:hypothetical protein
MLLGITLFLASSLVVNFVFSYCRKQANAWGGNKKIAIALISTSCSLIAVWGWFFFVHRSPENLEAMQQERAARIAEKECYSSSSAYSMSRKFVEVALKSPATARFPDISSVEVKALGGCMFSVRAYVDSQNGFGAMIRTGYLATLVYFKKEGEWRLMDMKMQ